MYSYNRPVLVIFVLTAGLFFANGIAMADKWTGPDKVAHIGVTAGLTAGTYGLLIGFKPGMDMGHRALWAVTAGFGAGLFKEGLDLAFNTGQPSYKDLTMDLVGTATGLVFMLIMDAAFGGHSHSTHSEQGRR